MTPRRCFAILRYKRKKARIYWRSRRSPLSKSLSQKPGGCGFVDCWAEDGLEVGDAASRHGPGADVAVALYHPARFVAEFVDALGREGWLEFGVEIEGDPLGAPAYHPRALLSEWLYGFMTNVRSCRKLEAACRDQIPFLWLTGWKHPDHTGS